MNFVRKEPLVSTERSDIPSIPAELGEIGEEVGEHNDMWMLVHLQARNVLATHELAVLDAFYGCVADDVLLVTHEVEYGDAFSVVSLFDIVHRPVEKERVFLSLLLYLAGGAAGSSSVAHH
jgi:hypothetical protein